MAARSARLAKQTGRAGRTEKEMSVVAPYHRYPANSQPPLLYKPYLATAVRAPRKALIVLPHTLSEITGPLFGHGDIADTDNDLTRQHAGEPLGERIVVAGRVLDDNGRPAPNALIEIWQCNAAGRYLHNTDQHAAPLDPNFSGAGRTLTDASGNFRFVTIKPGAYPWKNHPNAWRPRHIHFSLFGTAFATRLVTQRLISKFDLSLTEPEWALGYRFDIVLRGREETFFENKK
jgi:protocatechuate 3,4-dioxygenase beta subunit